MTTNTTTKAPSRARGTGKIFLSYRREDADESAGRIRDWLTQPRRVPPGNLFMDVHDVPAGANFVQAVEKSIRQCKTMLVVIGPTWFVGPKAVSPYVQEEVRLALANKLQIIPVLVRGAIMPRPDELPDDIRELAFRNARKVRADDDFENDMRRLAAALGIRAIASVGFIGPPARVWGRTIVVLLVVALALGVLSQVPEGNPIWQVVHAHVIADASFVQQAGAEGWDNDGSTCLPEADGYHVIHNAACGAPPYDLNNRSTYTIAVTAREIGASPTNFYGLVYRASSAGRYEFLISSDGSVAAQIFVTGQPRRNVAAPPEPSSLINTGVGAVNRLEVRVTGSHFAFVINGSVFEQIDDTTFASGSVGFSSINANRILNPSQEVTDAERQTGEVVFTDFQITAPLFGG